MHRKYWCVITLLAYIFHPKSAYASGMEGFGFIIVLFILFVGAVPGAIIKLFLPLPAKNRGFLATKVFIIMIAEAIFMAISVVLGGMLVADLESSKYQPMFLFPAIPIYLVLAAFPNLLLFREENQRFAETVSKGENILRAAFIGLITPACFGLLIALVAY